MRTCVRAVAGALAVAASLGGCSGETPSDSAGRDGTGDHGRESLTVVMSGDVLLHNTTWASAAADASAQGRSGYDFAPMFASVRPVIEKADLAICHLETPLAPPAGPFQNYPVFSAPPQVLDGLRETGYDLCTTASNHSVDKGFEGVARTVRAFGRYDLPFAGTARTRSQARRTPFVDAAGAKVAVLSYTFGTNGMPIEKPWSVKQIDPATINADAARAKERGADLVFVALHDGAEYVTEPTPHQRQVVDSITRSDDIDLVYGHHAHTSQPFDVVNGTWVAYGLGNFIAQQEESRPETYRGTTAEFTLERDDAGEWSVDTARFVPTQITRQGQYADSMRVLDARAALVDPDTPASLLPLLRETIAEVREASFGLGAHEHGLRMAPYEGP